MNAWLKLDAMNSPADLVRAVYAGLVAGDDEALVDEITRAVRAGHSTMQNRRLA